MSRDYDPIAHSIFSGSEALGEIDELKTHNSGDYYAMVRTCETCGRPKECQVSWLEVYCLANNVLPQKLAAAVGQPGYFETEWTFDPKFRVYHPNAHCTCHNNPLIMFNLVPAEAERLYANALKNQVISPAQRKLIFDMSGAVQQLQAGARTLTPQQAQMRQQQMMQQQQQAQMMQRQPQAMQGYPPGYRPQGR